MAAKLDAPALTILHRIKHQGHFKKHQVRRIEYEMHRNKHQVIRIKYHVTLSHCDSCLVQIIPSASHKVWSAFYKV